MFKKMCRCGAIIPHSLSRCKKCEESQNKDRADYYREYDKGRPKHHNIYHTQAWKKVRKIALVRDNYLCQHCLSSGRIVQATTVHHIEPLEDDEDRAYDINNLIGLCDSCHRLIHNEYEISNKSKKLLQETLYRYIKQVKELL